MTRGSWEETPSPLVLVDSCTASLIVDTGGAIFRGSSCGACCPPVDEDKEDTDAVGTDDTRDGRRIVGVWESTTLGSAEMLVLVEALSSRRGC